MTGSVIADRRRSRAVFYATPLGKTAQAVFQSERGAALVGINVSAFQGTMWGIGAAMAALGGILIAPVTLLYPDLAAATLIRAFAAMTLGGFGSFLGAAVGGMLLGLSELLVGAYISSRLIDITAYLIIIAVLLIRPSGLFGRQTSCASRVRTACSGIEPSTPTSRRRRADRAGASSGSSRSRSSRCRSSSTTTRSTSST